MITMEINDNGEKTLILAKDWIQATYKLNQYLTGNKISYPLGEDENIQIVEKEIKNTDKFR
jgi:hypothetical protein